MTTAPEQNGSHPAATSDPSADRHHTTTITGDALAAKIKELLHEGTVRRIVVRNDQGHTVMEIPVTAGIIAAVALPILIAVGAIAALANDWKIEVHRNELG